MSEEQIERTGPKIIISGGPASGKGTQCDFIVKELNVVHLSSGDMLRAAVESGTEEGLKAQAYMNNGELVPDDLIINIVAHRVMEKDCLERGFVLDGFPRTAAQVEALIAAGVQCDVFLQIDVADEAIIQRVAGRRMDPETGKIYHLTHLPPPEDIIHRLQQRDDDTEEKIKVRLATYHRNLAGIIDNFSHCTVAVNTNNKNPQQIWREFRKGMKRYVNFNETAVSNCRVPKIIISGGPASGKGTQCDFIVKEWNVVHLSSGDMLRAAIESRSEEGLKAQEYMNRGELVPDELIINIVAHRVMEKDCLERGFVLDGFPRTAVQVEALIAAGVQCDVFLQIDVDDEAIIQRVAGRRMDPETGKIYHLTYLPPPEDIIHRLKQRDDDTEAKIKVRLATYHRNLAGIINNFSHCTVAVNTNNKNPQQIWREFRQKMKRYLKFHVIFVLGAPRSGKSVLCQAVAEKCEGYQCISVPNLLAAEADSGNEDSEVIKKLLAGGKEIPIDLVIKLISNEMFKIFNSSSVKASKFIIDGFSNTSISIDKWYEMMGHCSSVDFFLYLDTPADILQKRLQETRVSAEAAAEQIASYHEEVLPLLCTLDGSGKLRKLDAFFTQKMIVNEVSRLISGIDIINPFERTFAIIKPDAVSDGKAHEIHRRIVEDGRLIVLASKLVQFDAKAAEEFYAQEYKESTKKNALKSFMKSGPSLCLILEGSDAVKVWRSMLGPTDSRVAVVEAPTSFRALYGSDECRNAVHGSDSEGAAMHEIDFLLSSTGSGQRLASVIGTKADLNPLNCLSSFSREDKNSGGLVLEDTCAILKPLTAELYYDEIISVMRSNGFVIVSEIKTLLSEGRCRELYAEHKDKDFFEQLVSYMCTRRVVFLQLRRVGAINAWRNLMGSADLERSRLDRPDSLRAVFATDMIKNAVGGSDSRNNAQRDITRYFSFMSTAPVITSTPEEDALELPHAKKTLPPIVGSPQSQAPSKKYKSPYELGPVSRGDMVDMNGYNKSKIHPVLGPVINKLILERPSNVREFILDELQKPV